MKICEVLINTPLTTGDKGGVTIVSILADETDFADVKISKPSVAAPLLFCRELD